MLTYRYPNCDPINVCLLSSQLFHTAPAENSSEEIEESDDERNLITEKTKFDYMNKTGAIAFCFTIACGPVQHKTYTVTGTYLSHHDSFVGDDEKDRTRKRKEPSVIDLSTLDAAKKMKLQGLLGQDSEDDLGEI